MIYVALLRGINVGGKAKIAMQALKKTFENVGCEQVQTYINSGNVIFADSRKAAEIMPIIEAAIVEDFGLNIPVVLRDQPTINALCADIPKQWTNDSEQKTDVLFLRDEINNADILNAVEHNPAIENVRYMHGALVWNVARENVTKGNGIKLIKTSVYGDMTVRNINTVRKIQSLMDQK